MAFHKFIFQTVNWEQLLDESPFLVGFLVICFDKAYKG